MCLGHWRGGHVGEVFAGILPHPGREKIPFGCSKISQSLKLQRRKTSCATSNNHRKIEYSRVTGGRSEDKTLTHPKFWPYFFKLVLMEMENPHCGVIQEPGILKSSLWGGVGGVSAEALSLWIQGNFDLLPLYFLKIWKMLARPKWSAKLPGYVENRASMSEEHVFPVQKKWGLKYSSPQQNGANPLI